LAPVKQDVQNVLDIGTGTGLWAIEFGACQSIATSMQDAKLSSADKHPSAIVIGTDLSPIQPTLLGTFANQVPVTIIANST
jgi:methylase of polypeptide subunit release factors